MVAISHMSNITGLTVSMQTITDRIKKLINPVSAAADIVSDSFHSYQLLLDLSCYRVKVYIDSEICNNLSPPVFLY